MHFRSNLQMNIVCMQGFPSKPTFFVVCLFVISH